MKSLRIWLVSAVIAYAIAAVPTLLDGAPNDDAAQPTADDLRDAQRDAHAAVREARLRFPITTEDQP